MSNVINIENPLVYVVVLNFNGADDTVECVESLQKITYSNYRIIVVDNKSNDLDLDKLDTLRNFSNCEILLNKTNDGYAGGNNVGIKYAYEHGADYVCVINNDTVVDIDFLSFLVRAAENDKSIGVVCPKIFEYYNRNNVSYGGGEINYLKGGVYIYGINEVNETIYNMSRYITFATGCCMLIARKIIDTVGYLPEDYFLYYEDTDYSVKVNKKCRIYYESNSIIYHKESASTKAFSDNYQYYFVRNRLLFIRRYFTCVQKLTAYPITFLYILKKMRQGFTIYNVKDAVFDFLVGRTGQRQTTNKQ